MPKYFFHVDDTAGTVADQEGIELRDDEVARQEALLAVRELVAEALRRGKVLDGRAMRVTDSGGRKIVRIAFRDVIRFE